MSKLPAADALTVLRIIPSRMDKTGKQVVSDWKADRNSRAQAEQARRDRARDALDGFSKEEIDEILSEKPGDAAASVAGVSAKGSAGKTKKH